MPGQIPVLRSDLGRVVVYMRGERCDMIHGQCFTPLMRHIISDQEVY